MLKRGWQLCIALIVGFTTFQAHPAIADQLQVHVPSPEFQTIQAAVDSLPDGGEPAVIILRSGTYFENVRIQGKNVVIIGDPTKPSTTVIDGNGTGSPVCLLDTEVDSIVYLRGLTLTGGTGRNTPGSDSSRGGGLAVQEGYTVFVQDCVFEDNHARWGGAVDNVFYSRVVMSGVTFRSNTADARGGAINAWAPCSLDGCTFIGNTAVHGGHINLGGGPTADHMITNSHFEAGRALYTNNPLDRWSGSGGAILVDKTRTSTIRNCTFENNHADAYGGAIGATPHALRSFEECLAEVEGCYPYGVTLEDCTFNGCSGLYGGAIAWVNSGNWSGERLRIENCIAHEEGGGIYSAFGYPFILDSSFSTCLALSAGNGGGVRAKSGAVELHSCSFEQCVAVHGAGGAISLEDSSLLMVGSTLTANAAMSDGAAIQGLRSTVDVSNSIIQDHVRTAAVYLDLEDLNKRNEFSATQFIDNGADADPGSGPSAVSLVQEWSEDAQQRQFTTFAGCIFDGNDGSMHGGGAIRTDGMWVELKQGEYRNNTTAEGDTNGGVLHVRRANVQVWEGLFENNRSGRSGGAIYLEHAMFDAIDPRFVRNKADLYGGAIEMMFGSSGGVVRGIFDGGNAINAEFGGAIDLDPSCGAFEMVECSFENHRVLNGGGAVYAGGALTRVIECSIRGNHADAGGGIQSGTQDTWIEDSEICSNTVDQVAGLFTDGGGNSIADECCEGDIDGDGLIDGSDLSQVLGAWGQSGSQIGGADLNKDGVVDGSDLAEVLGKWGPCQ